ncbi:Clp1/GlmU family protein [Aeropyrum camini]|uniref:Clp1/GlmU family protein n=1 Tax=Aeropyrum camini TaxID=229980 RepID=UPI001E57AC2C|nr:Clp1/GlmU family protein [Aeropyrum camini]
MEVAGGSALIRGPGRIEVVEGAAEVLGGRVDEGSGLVVPAGRAVLARVEGRALLSGAVSTAGADASYERFDSIAREALPLGRVAIVGPSDSGKSTLAAWIVNKSGGGYRLLSTDIGQNEVYAPGFVALASPRSIVIPGLDDSFSSVEPCFVGSFTPRGVESRYLACASRLASMAGQVVIDTDGWISLWEGLESKAALAIASRAKLVLAVGLPPRSARLLERVWGLDAVAVERLASQGGKTRGERALHRERLIALRTSGGRERRVRPGEAEIVGAPIFRGEPLPPDTLRTLHPTAIYGEKVDGDIVVVARRGGRPGASPGLRVLREGWEKGLIAAVHTGSGTYVGVVTRASYREPWVSVYTRAEGDIAVLEVGRSRVDVDSLMGRAKW